MLDLEGMQALVLPVDQAKKRAPELEPRTQMELVQQILLALELTEELELELQEEEMPAQEVDELLHD